jgi:L-alanine-DL-glutamate epimerase-like enolase superfamily enzyme
LEIKKIEAIPVTYHVKRKGWAETSKTGTRKYDIWPSTMPTIIVKIFTANGLMGVGEAMTMHWYMGNTQSHNYEAVRLYGEKLKGEDPANLERIHRTMMSTLGRGAPGVRAADDAIAMALLDLLGRARKEPVFNLLGGAQVRQIPINPNLYLGTPDQMAEEADNYVKRGYVALKIKCGMDIEKEGWSLDTVSYDVSKLTKTLEVVPQNVLVDADANQAWGSYKRTISIVKKYGLERYLNLGIEQPTNYLDIEGASKIAKAIGLDLVLDESIFSPEAFAEVVRRNAADRIVLKTIRVGGMYVGWKLITMAETFGIHVGVDSLPYSRIGETAMCHLAATMREPYPGAYEDDWLEEDPVKSGGRIVESGFASLDSSPGLGVELDDATIREITTKVL